MEWKDLSPATLEVMKNMGNYAPTVRRDLIKGYIGDEQEGQSYLDSRGLREIAVAFTEVAEFLEEVYDD